VAHQRKLIRDAVATMLTGQTAAGSRVLKTQVVPWQKTQLPALAVYTLQESAEESGSAPLEYKRTVSLAIEGAVMQASGVDDALDSLAEEIERVMFGDEWLSGTAFKSRLSSTETDFAVVGEKPVGLIRLTFDVTYHTDAPYPPLTPLADLSTVDVKYAPGGAVDQVEDTIENLEE
jgi:hypothetical protein